VFQVGVCRIDSKTATKDANDDPVRNFCVLARKTTPLYQAPAGMIELDHPQQVDALVAQHLKYRCGDLSEFYPDTCTDRAEGLTAVNGKYIVAFPLDVRSDGKSARYCGLGEISKWCASYTPDHQLLGYFVKVRAASGDTHEVPLGEVESWDGVRPGQEVRAMALGCGTGMVFGEAVGVVSNGAGKVEVVVKQVLRFEIPRCILLDFEARRRWFSLNYTMVCYRNFRPSARPCTKNTSSARICGSRPRWPTRCCRAATPRPCSARRWRKCARARRFRWV
tara:strand:+ start:775 stop:1611 length:837 start_codon:yes stop_codon:yes gene_type:complete